MGSPAPFSSANYLIINIGRFQVNFTRARCNSVKPEQCREKAGTTQDKPTQAGATQDNPEQDGDAFGP